MVNKRDDNRALDLVPRGVEVHAPAGQKPGEHLLAVVVPGVPAVI